MIKDGLSDNDSQYNFAYDTVSRKLFGLDRMAPDQVSCFLPVMGERSKNKGFMFFDQYLFGYISSLSMFSSFEKNSSRNPAYPPVLQEYFKTQNRKSNPVIVKMKLKDL